LILVIEDQSDARVALVKLIKKVGHDAIGVADGPQALLFLRESPVPRLIILDYHMPGMDGLEVLATVRSDPRTAAVPVVFFTAVTSEDLRQRAVAAGAQDFLHKGSMDWMAIVACIEKHVRPAHTPAPASGNITP
jgi:CheY-like chemotaxis protein